MQKNQNIIQQDSLYDKTNQILINERVNQAQQYILAFVQLNFQDIIYLFSSQTEQINQNTQNNMINTQAYEKYNSIYRSNKSIGVSQRKQFQKKYSCYKSSIKPLKQQPEDKKVPKDKKVVRRFQKKSKSVAIIHPIAPSKLYYISKGNNDSLIRSILENGDWEYGIATKSSDAGLLWLQQNKKFNYATKKASVLINMFQFHTELTNKDRLYTNLKISCRSKGLDVNEVVPVTFTLDFESQYIRAMLSEFLKYFVANHPHPQLANKLKGSFVITQENTVIKIRYKEIILQAGDSKELMKEEQSKELWQPKQKEQNNMQNEIYRSKSNQKQHQKSSKLTKNQDIKTKYVWILKPANLNRGRNVKLFYRLKQLEQLLSSKDPHAPFKMYTETQKQTQTRYVIQRYIDQPLLINRRKFDIRVWILIDCDLQCYFFKQGYLRLSGQEFNLNKESLENSYVHLTNNAIQKNADSYGKYQEGNQLSFQSFKKYLEEQTTLCFQDIISRIKELIKLSLQATINLINEKGRKGCFQLLGYDFLIDERGHVWLIECNSNPCLEESSGLLCKLLPLLLKQILNIVHKKKFNQNYFERIL